jgi:hypothetical protein
MTRATPYVGSRGFEAQDFVRSHLNQRPGAGSRGDPAGGRRRAVIGAGLSP